MLTLIAHILMLVCVFLFVAGSIANFYNIMHKVGKVRPWTDGLLAAYIVAYFTFPVTAL